MSNQVIPLLISKADFTSDKLIPQATDTERVNKSIRDAQQFDLRPALGDAMYYDLVSKIDDSGYDAKYDLLMGGEEYRDSQGNTIIFSGLRMALKYWAYARYLSAQQINVTTHGIRIKENDFSQNADAKSVGSEITLARNGAAAYFEEAKKYLDKKADDFPLWNCGSSSKTSGLRINAIGGDSRKVITTLVIFLFSLFASAQTSKTISQETSLTPHGSGSTTYFRVAKSGFNYKVSFASLKVWLDSMINVDVADKIDSITRIPGTDSVGWYCCGSSAFNFAFKDSIGSGSGSNKVDTIYRTAGKDSIQFTIDGRYHAIKDSAGGGATSPTAPLYGVQYDSAGFFSANKDLLYDYTNKRFGIGVNGTLPTQNFQVTTTSKNAYHQNSLWSSGEAFNYLGIKSASQWVTWGINDDVTLYSSPFFVYNTATEKFPFMVSHANDGNGSVVIGAGNLGGNMAPAYFQNHTLELMPKGTDGAQLVMNSAAIGGGSWAFTINGTDSPYGRENSVLFFDESLSPLTSGRIALLDSTGFLIGRRAYNDPLDKSRALMHLRNYYKTDTLFIAEDSAGVRAMTIEGDGDIYLPQLAAGSSGDSSVVYNPTTKKLGYYIKPGGSGGGGSVTSVALSLPSSELTVSGSPVTTSGTLSATWANQTTNKVFAAPNGSTGTPTFRLLDTTDISGFGIKTRALFSAGTGLTYNTNTGVFSYSGGGITNLNGATAATQNFVNNYSTSGDCEISTAGANHVIRWANASLLSSAGIVNKDTQSFGGQKRFYAAPRFATFSTNGGIYYGDATGVLQQTGAGTSTQVLHGGTSPSYSAVNLATDVTGSLPNGNLANSSITMNGTAVSLGGTSTDTVMLVAVKFDDGDNTPADVDTFYYRVPETCTIVRTTIIGTETGNITMQIWSRDYSTSTRPTVSDAIYASDPPTVSSALSAEKTSFTGWGLTLLRGKELGICLSANSAAREVTFLIECTK